MNDEEVQYVTELKAERDLWRQRYEQLKRVHATIFAERERIVVENADLATQLSEARAREDRRERHIHLGE